MDVINASVGLSVLITSLFLKFKTLLFGEPFISIATLLITFCTPFLFNNLLHVFFVYVIWAIFLYCKEIFNPN